MFIAKNNDLIILVRETREELEQALNGIEYTSIEETDTEYQLYNGEYLTPTEVEEKEEVRINNLTMTALDFINFLKQVGLTDEDIEDYLSANLNVKHQLQFCQNVYCGVAKALMPIKYNDKIITAEMVEQAFKIKNGEVAA